ncbi:MAG: PaaI family thioesterase [Planctomycetota bacterium]|jgi:acyl-CoA thioesterase|nr:PaaI family thioesterase [Planctomycetota bacterium]
MLVDLEKIRRFFAADRFAASNGIVIDQVSEDEVVCSFRITPDHLNAGGNVQGGAIFTLADLAFAVHCNLRLALGEEVGLTVGQSCAISFFKPPRGNRLLARSHCLSHGRHVSVYRISVLDEEGRLIAEMQGNGFTTPRPVQA